MIEKSLALNQLPDSDDTVNLLAAWFPNKTATVSRVLAPGADGLGLAYGRHKITFRSDSIIKSKSQVFKVSTGGMNAITFNRACVAPADSPQAAGGFSPCSQSVCGSGAASGVCGKHMRRGDRARQRG